MSTMNWDDLARFRARYFSVGVVKRRGRMRRTHPCGICRVGPSLSKLISRKGEMFHGVVDGVWAHNGHVARATGKLNSSEYGNRPH
eukprot:1028482-Pyramimonas_sp.AAC.1